MPRSDDVTALLLRRRRFLALLGAGAGLGVAGGLAWPRPARAADAAPSFIERSTRPLNYETPLDVLSTRITPVDRFYVRNHFDDPIGIEASTYRLKIDGLVEKPLSLSLAELEKLPQVTVEAVLQCAGNGRGLFRPQVAGVQWERGAVGNARWTGPRLKDVLALARPKADAKHVELQGLERPVLAKTPAFIRGIPVDKALHKDTILALRMNDAPLRKVHGFPARLVAPGWVADDWIKWLERLTLLPDEPKGFFYETGYRYPVEPGAPGAAVPPEKMKTMSALVVKSLIAAPLAGAVVAPGKLTVRGVAFSGGNGVARVEVSADGGATFADARLVDKGGAYGFTVFERDVTAAPGKLRLVARATDGAGNTQPTTPVWNPAGYLYNAVDGVDVEVRS